MTESEWLTSANTSPMMEFIRTRASERKLRLLACGCCRLWPIANVNRSSGSADVGLCIELAERWAEGEREAEFELKATLGEVEPGNPAWVTPSGAAHLRSDDAWDAAKEFQKASDYGRGEAIAGLLHNLFGNPFHEVRYDPIWRTPAVLSLARAVCEERLRSTGQFEQLRLAILADAVEEAGCSEMALLEHLRSAGPHLLGCWAVDLVLDRR